MKAEVSVVCAWYNRADYIRQTVESILTQNFDGLEMVVVNDGSPDPRVREILNSYTDPRMRVIHQENAGFVNAIRRAIDESNAPYIAVQGSAEISLAERIKNQWSFLQEHKGHVAVSSRALNLLQKDDGREWKLPSSTYVGEVTSSLLQRKNPMVHGGAMYRRSAYVAVGGYRRLFTYAQDIDLWLRMAKVGKISVLASFDVHRTMFSSDGVGAVPTKIALQTRLACLARQIAKEVEAGGEDFLQTYGDQGMLFLRPDASVSKRTAACYVKEMIKDPESVSSFLAKQSWADGTNLYSATANFLTYSKTLRKLSSAVLKKMKIDK